MKKYFLLLVIACVHLVLSAQETTKLDSLKAKLSSLPPISNTEQNSEKLKIFIEIGDEYYNINNDSAIWWYKQVVSDSNIVKSADSNHINISKQVANAFQNISIIEYYLGVYDSAITNSLNAIKVFETIQDKAGIARAYNNLGNIETQLANYDSAIQFFNLSLENAREINDTSTIVNSLINTGHVFFIQYDIDNAYVYYYEALEISRKTNNLADAVKSLIQIAVIEAYNGNFSASNNYNNEALKIYSELNDKIGIIKTLINLSANAIDQGNNKKAEDYLNEALQACYSANYTDGLATCFSNLGILKANQGLYSEAIEYYESASKLANETNDFNSIALNLYNLSNIAAYQKNYPKAISYLKKAQQIFEDINDTLLLAKVWTNMGTIEMLQNNYEIANEYYERAILVFEKENDKQGLAACIANLGMIAQNQNKFDIAHKHYQSSLKIDEELDDLSGISANYKNIGTNKLQQGKYDNSISYLNKAIKIKEQINDTENLISTLNDIGTAYFITNSHDKAIKNYLRAKELALIMLKDNFSILSESEKEMYLENIKIVLNSINQLCYISENKTDSLAGIVYNNELNIKGLLLSSFGAMQNAIASSNDTAMQNSYSRFKLYKNEIAAIQALNLPEYADYLIETQELANQEEKNLVKLSSQFANMQNLFSYKWQDVQNSLGKNDIAIEFLEIEHVNHQQNVYTVDSISYVAIILRKDSKFPTMIPLCNYKDLAELFYTPNLSENSETQNTRSIIFKEEIINFEKCYNLIWQPLETHLKNIKNVYLSPTGLLNKVAFAAIKTKDNKILLDKYNLHTVSSTRNIINKNKTLKYKFNDITLFGGIRYDYNADLAEKLIQYHNINDADIKNKLLSFDNTNKHPTWKYLHGTLKEVNNIESIFVKNKYAPNTFIGNDGLEETFKKLSDERSPEIIHISTHGFNIPKNTGENKYDIFENSFVQNDNPLFRTGLLFAGAERTWNKSEAIKEIEDGILTAYEVSNLNLSNTKLVVLSACETGLGDIKGTEGVYGLIRAFKMAGAESIIASLWQIPDKETEIFMTKFYKNLLKQKNIEKAFKNAQKFMRKKHSSYYWAALVLYE